MWRIVTTRGSVVHKRYNAVEVAKFDTKVLFPHSVSTVWSYGFIYVNNYHDIINVKTSQPKTKLCRTLIRNDLSPCKQ